MVPSFALIIFYYSNLKISQVVVALFIGSGMSDEINVMLWVYSNIESTMMAIERCQHFQKNPPEPQYRSYDEDLKLVNGSTSSVDKLKASQDNNTQVVVIAGKIEFKGMSCKYATSTVPTLSISGGLMHHEISM